MDSLKKKSQVKCRSRVQSQSDNEGIIAGLFSFLFLIDVVNVIARTGFIRVTQLLRGADQDILSDTHVRLSAKET